MKKNLAITKPRYSEQILSNGLLALRLCIEVSLYQECGYS